MKVKLVKVQRQRCCYQCDKDIPKGTKVLSIGFIWWCSPECYNEYEASLVKSEIE